MKYKHKKTGIEVEKRAPTQLYDTIRNGSPFSYPSEIIEDSSDWEKIEERDYVVTDSFYGEASGRTIIQSVKRLSDGVEFKIGDIVKEILSNNSWKIWKIDKISKDFIAEVKEQNINYTSITTIPICNLKHYEEPKKTPLYTTEDGVERYEFQREWWIRKYPAKNWEFIEGINSYVRQNDVEYGRTIDTWKAFSTKKAAEAWMERNNPKYVFTTSDGVKINVGNRYYFVNKPKEGDKMYLNHNDAELNRYQGEDEKTFIYFSTKELAQKYIDDNSKFLLTTDNVKLKIGETIYYVIFNFDIYSTPVAEGHISNGTAHPSFSTKEKAEEYVLWNKPSLSLNDIVFKDVYGSRFYKIGIDRAIELAKSKQNG